MKRQLLAAGIVTAISATSLVGGAAIASAETQGTSSSNPMSGLVNALAQKFNLKTADVQAVFDEQRTAMQAQREAEIKTQVSQLVTDGKLTQAQADALNTKRAELLQEREVNRSSDQALTQDERATKRDERRAELDAWLKENGIDSQYAYLLMGKGGFERGGHGPGGRGVMGGDESESSTSSSGN